MGSFSNIQDNEVWLLTIAGLGIRKYKPNSLKQNEHFCYYWFIYAVWGLNVFIWSLAHQIYLATLDENVYLVGLYYDQYGFIWVNKINATAIVGR